MRPFVMMAIHVPMVILVCLDNVFRVQGALTVMMETPVQKMDVTPVKMVVCTGQQRDHAVMKTVVPLVIFVRQGRVFLERLLSIVMMGILALSTPVMS
jgi:hypothetical protein